MITRRVDARDWIATDDQFGAAEVDREASSHNIREGVQADDSFEVLITEGFIGKQKQETPQPLDAAVPITLPH